MMSEAMMAKFRSRLGLLMLLHTIVTFMGATAFLPEDRQGIFGVTWAASAPVSAMFFLWCAHERHMHMPHMPRASQKNPAATRRHAHATCACTCHVHMYMHACTRALTRTHTCMHTHMHTHMQVRLRASYLLTYSLTYLLTYLHMQVRLRASRCAQLLQSHPGAASVQRAGRRPAARRQRRHPRYPV